MRSALGIFAQPVHFGDVPRRRLLVFAVGEITATYTGGLTAFLSPAPFWPPALTEARRRANERSRLNRVGIVRLRRPRHLPCVSVMRDRHEGQNSGRRQLLALHEVRRIVERVANGDASTRRVCMAMTSQGLTAFRAIDIARTAQCPWTVIPRGPVVRDASSPLPQNSTAARFSSSWRHVDWLDTTRSAVLPRNGAQLGHRV
jgi:hypothetical protein